MALEHRYAVYVRGDSLQEATEESAHLLYFFLNRLLQEQRMQAREMGAERYLAERQFEDFAIQILALLQQYQNVHAEYLARSTADE